MEKKQRESKMTLTEAFKEQFPVEFSKLSSAGDTWVVNKIYYIPDGTHTEVQAHVLINGVAKIFKRTTNKDRKTYD